MHAEELSALIAVGYEQRGVEFKPPGERGNSQLFARVTRAVLGMANHRDGGKVVIGVVEEDRAPVPKGLTAAELATWKLDDVMAALAPYAALSSNWTCNLSRWTE